MTSGVTRRREEDRQGTVSECLLGEESPDMQFRETVLHECLLDGHSRLAMFLASVGVLSAHTSLCYKLWSGVLTTIFFAYFMCFLVEFLIGLVTMFADFFWVMCFAMMLKCTILYVALRKIRGRLNSPVLKNFLVQVEGAVHKSKVYLYITIFFNIATIVLNIITKTLDGEVAFVDIYFYIMLAVGSTVFTGYMSAVILFSVADARVAQDGVRELIRLTNEKEITPSIYINMASSIKKIVEESFWLDGALLACILMNTVAAIVLLLIYNNITHGKSVFYTVAFLLYILMIMWITDLVFLYLVIPEITLVNDLFIDFHRILARKVCDIEADDTTTVKSPLIQSKSDSLVGRRSDTLHLLVSDPIRYTIIGGLYLNTREFCNRVIAVVLAICFSVGRFVFLFVVSYN